MAEVDRTPPRDPACVAGWPECESGAYDPRCCRFPKECACTSYPPDESPAATPSLTPAQQTELERELGLEASFLAAERALREIAENTTRTSYQHRARALLALEELERRWDQ